MLEPSSPRELLQEDSIAGLFHHYVVSLAPWYDLSDVDRHFAKHVPRVALQRPLLFSAVIAFAAIHKSRTGTASAKSTAEHFHGHCVRLLIGLNAESRDASDGAALAAVCLLRSYEILAENSDPNRHLVGAYALAAAQPLNLAESSMARAGFFNYLREDITYSLIHRLPLKLDLRDVDEDSYVVTNDEDQLNVASILLGKVINSTWGAGSASKEAWHTLEIRLRVWHRSLPAQFESFSETVRWQGSTSFTNMWMLNDCHVAVMQYYLVARMLIAIGSDRELLDSSASIMVRESAVKICALAFTSGQAAVLVNSFGPITFCGRYIADAALQQELLLRLRASGRDTGWPVQRMIDQLVDTWDRM